MSTDSLALLRKNSNRDDITALAEEHFKHDLNETDRDTLKNAAGKVGMHTTIGSIVGLGLGLLLAYRVRSTRTRMFNAFHAAEKPTGVRFADGREGGLTSCFCLRQAAPSCTSTRSNPFPTISP